MKILALPIAFGRGIFGAGDECRSTGRRHGFRRHLRSYSDGDFDMPPSRPGEPVTAQRSDAGSPSSAGAACRNELPAIDALSPGKLPPSRTRHA